MKKIDESTKVTLTLGQLKRLVKEDFDVSIFDDKFGNDPWKLAKQFQNEPEFKRILDFLGMNLIEYLWNHGEPLDDAKNYCNTPAWKKVTNMLIDELREKEYLMKKEQH